ncbi:MAG: hypothetical protein ACLQOO_19135 [Terriglobia bacterium]
MENFAQGGQQTLFEVIDKEGRAWKIDSVESDNATAYSVISPSGRIDIMATAFNGAAGAQHAVILVDSAEKEEALAVLDKKFLSGLTNQSDAYRKWLDKNAVFTYGGVQETRTLDVKQGGLGSSDIRVEGGAIVGKLVYLPCHCTEVGLTCTILPEPDQACVNKCCDYVNCILGGGTCGEELSTAAAACSFRAQ